MAIDGKDYSSWQRNFLRYLAECYCWIAVSKDFDPAQRLSNGLNRLQTVSEAVQ
jgi:hypothetical protein